MRYPSPLTLSAPKGMTVTISSAQVTYYVGADGAGWWWAWDTTLDQECGFGYYQALPMKIHCDGVPSGRSEVQIPLEWYDLATFPANVAELDIFLDSVVDVQIFLFDTSKSPEQCIVGYAGAEPYPTTCVSSIATGCDANPPEGYDCYAPLYSETGEKIRHPSCYCVSYEGMSIYYSGFSPGAGFGREKISFNVSTTVPLRVAVYTLPTTGPSAATLSYSYGSLDPCMINSSAPEFCQPCTEGLNCTESEVVSCDGGPLRQCLPKPDGVTNEYVAHQANYQIGIPTTGLAGRDYKLCWAFNAQELSDFNVEVDAHFELVGPEVTNLRLLHVLVAFSEVFHQGMKISVGPQQTIRKPDLREG